MSDHPLKALIESADRSISAKDFDGLMRFYTDDATLVVNAGKRWSDKTGRRDKWIFCLRVAKVAA